MIPVPSFANKRVAVMGLGVAGLAAARALAASGADVLAWDDAEAGRIAAAAAGIAATDLGAVDWTADLPLVLSPGIPDAFPAPHPVAAAARAANAEILCDIELLARSVPAATCVTVTGTNGKSTTTALIGHILRAAGRRVEVGGNFGPPALGLEPLDAGGIYVLELSSYQLDRTYSLRAQATVLLNIAEDHLERHGRTGRLYRREAPNLRSRRAECDRCGRSRRPGGARPRKPGRRGRTDGHPRFRQKAR